MTSKAKRKLIAVIGAIALVSAVALCMWFLVFGDYNPTDNPDALDTPNADTYANADTYEFVYKPVAEAVADAKTEQLAGKKYQNFTLPDKFDIDNITELYTFTTNQEGITKADEEAFGQKFANFLCSDNSEFRWIVELDGETFDISANKELENFHGYFGEQASIDVEGTTAFYVKTAVIGDNYAEDMGLTFVDAVVLSYEEMPDTKYMCKDGHEYSMPEILEYTDKLCKEKIAPIFAERDNAFSEFEPYGIRVFKNNCDRYYFDVIFEPIYKGTTICTDPGNFPLPICSGAYIGIGTAGCDVSYIENIMMYNTDPVAFSEPVENIITLESALDFLEKYLAPESNYTVSQLSLQYHSVLVKDESELGKVDYRPYWCLTVGMNEQVTNLWYPFVRKIIYIDAQTGETFCYSTIKAMNGASQGGGLVF